MGAVSAPRCDLVIISCNQLEYTKGCIASIEKNTAYPHRIIIVDNASDKETLAYLRELAGQGRIILIANAANEGWVKAVNKGIYSSDAEYVCVMNNDTVVYPGWLGEMAAAAERDDRVGLVNPQWQMPKRYAFGRDFYFRTAVRTRKGRFIETDWARGFCFLITRALLNRIGGLDLEFSPAYYDDWDYSVRAVKNGFTVARALGAFVWHYKNVTYDVTLGGHGNQVSLLRQKGLLFHQRWGFPLRVLFVGTQSWDAGTRDQLIRELLRDQHRVTVINPGCPTGIAHTNFRETRVPGFLSAFAGLYALLDNRRLSHRKRFDLVICDDKTKGLLTRVKAIKDAYRFFTVSGVQSRPDILRLVSHLKHDKKGS